MDNTNSLFGDFDFGFGIEDEDADFTPIKEVKKTEKKTEKSTSKGSVKKNAEAKKVTLEYPVTFIGRAFRYTVKGEGATNLQEAAEKLYDAGFKEIAHEGLRFFKVDEGEVVVDYRNLKATESDTLIELPVAVVDGQKVVEYSEKSDFELDEDDDVSVSDLNERGINDELYGSCNMCYDPTSGIALPVFEECADFTKSAKHNDIVVCFGKPSTISDPATVVKEQYGEIPEKCRPFYANPQDGIYFIYVVPEESAVSIDRSKFGVKKVSVKKAEERFKLPLTVWIPMFNQEIVVSADDMGEKKPTWEKMLAHLKKLVRPLNSPDRKVDHMYVADENKLCVAIYSGSKGAMLQTREEVERFVESLCIPKTVLREILSYFAEDLTRESIVQIWREGDAYKVVKPCVQEAAKAMVTYSFPLDTKGSFIGTIHSHNTMDAFFSVIDDRDELEIPGLYGVIGSIRKGNGCYSFSCLFRYTLGLDKEPVMIPMDNIFKEVK